MRLDLHIHSTASDGSCPPEDVVDRALAGGLDVIALADHDTTAGVGPASVAAAGRPIQVVPAIELSSTFEGAEVHILGYFVDPSSPSMQTHRTRGRQRREARMREMVDRLALQGVGLRYEQLLAQLGGGDVAPARPHLARALVEAGYAVSVPDAFARLIGNDSPAYVPTRITTPREAVESVLTSGGLPVWAHPEAEMIPRLLDDLTAAGLAGLEAYRPWAPPGHVQHLEELARARGLFVTGGSDWHGPEGGREVGDFFVTADEIPGFLASGHL